MRVYELPRNDRRHDEITPGIELGQPGPKLRLVPELDDEVAAGRRVKAEDGRLEHQRWLVPELDGEPVGHPDMGPRVRLRKGDRFHGAPHSPHLVSAMDHEQTIAEEAQPGARPAQE